MLFNNITLIDEDIRVRENMYVGTKGAFTLITWEKRNPKRITVRFMRAKTSFSWAGFVNAHAHSPMTLMRGYGENMNLQDWLNKKIFPFEANLNEESVYYGTYLPWQNPWQTELYLPRICTIFPKPCRGQFWNRGPRTI